MSTSITNLDDLRLAYTSVFRDFAILTSDLVEETDGRINNRYARELLGTLQSADLIVLTEGEEGDVWQTLKPGTYNTHTLDEALAFFDEWAAENAVVTEQTDKPVKEKKTSTPRVPKETKMHDCYCGCGEQVPAKSFYKPGHDARHAGVIGREIAAGYATKGFDRRELLTMLPSDKLVAKAEGIAEKAIERIEAKQAKADAEPITAIDAGEAKVGKNWVQARKHADTGLVEVHSSPEGWVEASKSAAKTFRLPA